jgi:hypothetical protein
MAAFKVKGIRKLEIKVKKKFLAIQKDKKMLNEIGKFHVERIKAFARKGKPLRSLKYGKPGRFPMLADATPAMRKEIARNNQTHKTYGKSGKKRNLTISGQLIEATKYKIKQTVISIFVQGRRKKYRDQKGKRIDGPSTNQELFDDLLDRSSRYNFLGLDKLGLKRINLIIKSNLRRLLK